MRSPSRGCGLKYLWPDIKFLQGEAVVNPRSFPLVAEIGRDIKNIYFSLLQSGGGELSFDPSLQFVIKKIFILSYFTVRQLEIVGSFSFTKISLSQNLGGGGGQGRGRSGLGGGLDASIYFQNQQR